MVKPTSKMYSVNEKVLCNHKGMMYEAKILEIRNIDNEEIEYHVHYQGWNNRWDEWVADDRLFEYNEENLKKQQELEAAKAEKRSSSGKTGGGGSQRSRASHGEGTSGKSKTPGTGGKSKPSGSSGPPTPFDGTSKTGGGIGIGDSAGGGLELESRASTPSIDGSVSVASSSTTGQAATSQPASSKRKTTAKSKAATGGSVASTPAADSSQNVTDFLETPASSEPKRKRVRPSTATPTTQISAALQAPTGPPPVIPIDLTSPAPGVESLDQFRGRQEVQLKMPDDLKEVVVDDWDKIIRQMKICVVPAPKTIEDILSDYTKYKANQKGLPSGKQNHHAREVVEGIREYFNEMCGVHLLYKFERPQYHDILQQRHQDENDDSSSADEGSISERRSHLTSFYGFPHLLRLFVRMGHMLAYTDLDPKSIDTMLAWIQEFLKFLSRNKTTYFRPDGDYAVAPPDYQRKAFSN